MRSEWELPAQQVLATEATSREVLHVLIEYDGPQLVLLQAGSKYFLGLAADYDEQSDRWVHAPITKLELEALARGGIAMREVFVSKTSIDIVDYDLDGQPRGMWAIAPGNIPKGILPVTGAPLPSFAQEHLKAELFPEVHQDTNPIFRLVGRPVYEHKISFAGLGTVVLNLQRLWSALAQTLRFETPGADGSRRDQPPPQTLLFGAMVTRSFGVELSVIDHDVFSKIAAEYTRLMRGAFQDDCEEFLRKESPDVLAAYREYLKGLKKLQVDVMAEFTHTPPVFMGHACAERMIRSPALRRSKSKGSRTASANVVTLQGYFERFGMNDRRFEFYNNVDANTISGRVSRDLVRRMRENRLQVSVGTSLLYDIDVKVFEGAGASEQKYEMVRYRPLSLF